VIAFELLLRGEADDRVRWAPAMDTGEVRFGYSAVPYEPQVLRVDDPLAAACIALGGILVLCTLAVPGEQGDPEHSVTVASSFG
jgi:hypothetical protein